MNLHVAFCWTDKDGDVAFFDLVLPDYPRSPRAGKDIAELRTTLEKKMDSDSVTILGWTEMWPAGGGEP